MNCGRSRCKGLIVSGLAGAKPESATPLFHLDRHRLQPAVGHYGIFNGRKWRERIAPVVEKWIAQHD